VRLWARRPQLKRDSLGGNVTLTVRQWVLAFAFALTACTSRTMSTNAGTVADVERHIRRLLEATDPHAFLVISVAGSPHFLQFSASSAAIELDFPLVTAEQQAHEKAIRQFCRGPDMSLRESSGSDGSRFLDCNLPRDAHRAAEIARQALRDLFGVADSARLTFAGDLLPPVAA